MNNKNRRANKIASDADLYKVSKSSINKFIEKERRHDELDRLREVAAQKRTYRRTMVYCVCLNLLFIILAILGLEG